MSDAAAGARTLKVFILADQEADALLMAGELRDAGYDVSWQRVETEAAFLSGLERGKYDLILADDGLPSFSARRALALLRERRLDIPFIIVTGSWDEEQALELIRMGASSTLLKDRPARLSYAVAAALEQKRLRDQDQKELERLRASEERLRRITENAPDTIYRYRLWPDVGYDYLSPAVKNYTGYPPEAFYEDWTLILRVVHPDDLAVLESHFRAKWTISEPYVLRWVHKDGSAVWTEQRNVPVYDERGRLVGVEGISRDITERVLFEREREAIMDVAAALRDSITRAEILAVVLEKVAGLLEADGAAVSSAGEEGQPVQIERGWGRWEAWQGTSLEIGPETYRQVVENRAPFDMPVGQDAGLAPLAAWTNGLGRLICVPLAAQGSVLGLLWVGRREIEREQTRPDDDLKILGGIANITASALLQARLFEETQQRLQHLTTLRTVDRAIAASLDLNLTLNVLLDLLIVQQGVDAAAVLLVDVYSHQLNFAGGRGFRVRQKSGAQQRLVGSLAGQVVLERRRMHITSLGDSSPAFPQVQTFLAEGFLAYLGIPLIAKGEILGVLEILSRRPRELDASRLDFLDALAGQVAIAIHNGLLFEKLQRTTHDIIQAYDETIEGWSRVMETRQLETRGHTDRVVWWTTALARQLGVADSDLIHLRRGALLHDIGKLALPDSILLKPGPLTGEERALVQKHPVYAFDWLSPIVYLHPALDIPYCHHEAWDGSGYPRGLKERQIPLAGRIFAVVDAWDSLRSDRPFREPWSRAKALDYIQQMSGVLYDPQVVDAFMVLIQQDREG